MLRIHLSPIFRIRGIDRPFSYLVKNGFSRHSATLLLQGQHHAIRLDHIERLCELLICEPHDLLAWYPDSNKSYPASYPLARFKPEDIPDIKETLTKTPFRELKSVTADFVRRNES